MSVLRKNFTFKELNLYWHALHHNIKRKTSVGTDKETKQKFISELETRLHSISREILRGEYQFSSLRPILIPKTSGGSRVINVPTIRDRFVQRLIFQILISKYEKKWKLPYSFSSMGGESTKEILVKLGTQCTRDKWIIKTDISRYFDTIDRAEMKRILHKEIRYTSLHKLLDQVVDCEHQAHNSRDEKEIAAAGILKGKGLRQGMTLSPLFAYLFLRREDERMPNGKYFRYVDDVVIIGDSRNEVEETFGELRVLFKKRGLNLHDIGSPSSRPKTELIQPRNSFEFLGIGISRKTDSIRFYVPNTVRAKIIEKIEKRADYKSLQKKEHRNWVGETSRYASELIQNYKSSYSFCENWNELEVMLRERQSYLANKITTTLSELAVTPRTPEAQYTLLKLFGIHK